MSRLLLLSFGLWMASLSLGLADPVSRNPPAVYQAEIAPLLTTVEPLLGLPKAKDSQAVGGEVLLREQIVILDELSRKTEVSHQVFRATAESGVEMLSRDVEQYHKKRSLIHLALARTLQPDGRSLAVRDEAVFLQTPQRAADFGVYDDHGEMVIIYPDVKNGSVTESVIVREERETRIPGHFTMARSFAAGWPIHRDRFVLEVPRALADRVRLTILGNGVPEPVREELKAGTRVRWTWEKQDLPAGRHETNRVPLLQTGPVVFISTLQHWEQFLAWYLPRAENSMVLSKELKRQIDDWTRDNPSPEEITALLLKKVASEIRYVGLEFGDGDLIPRNVNATWENQYGDCKDKSCLLAAMLRYKGITAAPALINTDFPGLIEKRSPDFRHFDHCITAFTGPDGGWLFCDPTIPGLAPGHIGPADGDREVLILQAGPQALWARTPVHDFGVLRHRLDLEMDAAGALSGWAMLEAEGYNAARHASI